MSVLDDFLRIRCYRKQAAEFQWLADNASLPSVQRRYRGIARHYSELADREEEADQTRMTRRLEELSQRRKQKAVPAASNVLASPPVNDNLTIGLLRLIQIYKERVVNAGRKNPEAKDRILLTLLRG